MSKPSLYVKIPGRREHLDGDEVAADVLLTFDSDDGPSDLARRILEHREDEEIPLSVVVSLADLGDFVEDVEVAADDEPPASEDDPHPEIGPIDTTNTHLVTEDKGRVFVGVPPQRPLSRAEALALGAWLTVMASATDDEVIEARRAIENT
jgi:hypothetical protein